VNLKKYSQLLIDECKRLEPCHAEVCADEDFEMKVVYENTDFSVASSSHSTILGLRVVMGNRLGFITTNSLDESDLREKAKEAQMIARLSPESPFHDIAALSQKSETFTMTDEKLSKLSAKEMLRLTELLVDESRKDPRVTLDRAEMTLQTATRVIQNSNGIFEEVKQTICHWFIMGMAKDGNEVTSFDYDGESAANLSEVEAKVMSTSKEFRESVIGSLGATGADSYNGLVLFHPAAIGALLASVIEFNVNARNQQEGMSKWKDIGAQVGVKNLTISEDPHDKTRPGSWTPFDREGVITKRHDIIKNGILNFTAHNAFTAKKGKVQVTGNASGGSRSIPGIGLHALTVGQGSSSQEELYKGLNKGLVLKRFSGNSDPVSGQFSGIAKNSWWVKNGERSGALKEVMISGNMFELLKNIKLIGKKTYRQMGSFDSPYLLIDGVSVTSA
jgi:PmbA protein